MQRGTPLMQPVGEGRGEVRERGDAAQDPSNAAGEGQGLCQHSSWGSSVQPLESVASKGCTALTRLTDACRSPPRPDPTWMACGAELAASHANRSTP